MKLKRQRDCLDSKLFKLNRAESQVHTNRVILFREMQFDSDEEFDHIRIGYQADNQGRDSFLVALKSVRPVPASLSVSLNCVLIYLLLNRCNLTIVAMWSEKVKKRLGSVTAWPQPSTRYFYLFIYSK